MASPIIASAVTKVVEAALYFRGKRGEIVSTYNSFIPHPRHYIVKAEDQLCASYVSAIFIRLSQQTGDTRWTEIVPPECGAMQLFKNMDALGRAVLDDKRTPLVGDLIFFGSGSTVSRIQHVGIVTEVNGRQIYFYDIQASVGRHTCPVGYDPIIGYATPDYGSMDAVPTPEPQPTPAPTPAPEPTPAPVSSKIEAGDLVHIKDGAKWYRGQNIKASVMQKNWYVIQNIKGRAVLGMSEDERSNIQSPIHEEDLILVRKANGGSVQPEPAVDVPPYTPGENEYVPLLATVKKATLSKLEKKAKDRGVSIGDVLDEMVV